MKILLGVCGSISAYKAIDLARALVNLNHEVKIVLTSGATKFVIPEVFLYLGVKEVYLAEDDFKNAGVKHVELARWCDKLVIAPLSANTLSNLVHGKADDLLTSLFLAFEKNKPILVFPAMNSEMLTHPFIVDNFNEIKKLKSLNNIYVSETNAGKLACEAIGNGKLPQVEEIVELIESIEYHRELPTKKIVITTGATIAPIDPVRFLTNSSSGITGYYLAKYFLKQNYSVHLIAGKYATKKIELLEKHPQLKIFRVSTVDDMFDQVNASIPSAQIFVASAAVTDIEFEFTDAKVKKENIGNSLEIKKSKDILKSVIGQKNQNLKTVGFAAETDLSDEILNKKQKDKPVDLLIGTKVHNGAHGGMLQGFNESSAFYKIKIPAGTVFEGQLFKEQLGAKILKFLNKEEFND